MPNTRKVRLPASKWEPQLLRFSVFPSPAASLNVQEQDWWKQVVGESPEAVVSQPRTGTYQAGGRYGDGRLVLNIDTVKVDWVYASLDDPNAELSLGVLEEHLKIFRDVTNKWLELDSAPSALRIAFGAGLLIPVNSREEGYSKLSTFIPIQLDPETSSDFIYQINRPRASVSKISGLRINRLTRWSVAIFGRLNFAVLMGGPSQIQPQMAQRFACLLELDINTAPEFQGELDKTMQQEVLDELVSLGLEIARKGDIP